MSENDWFVMRPQKAQAYGRPEADGFLVRKDSTAMEEYLQTWQPIFQFQDSQLG
jgi:hypothetical protein